MGIGQIGTLVVAKASEICCGRAEQSSSLCSRWRARKAKWAEPLCSDPKATKYGQYIRSMHRIRPNSIKTNPQASDTTTSNMRRTRPSLANATGGQIANDGAAGPTEGGHAAAAASPAGTTGRTPRASATKASKTWSSALPASRRGGGRSNQSPPSGTAPTTSASPGATVAAGTLLGLNNNQGGGASADKTTPALRRRLRPHLRRAAGAGRGSRSSREGAAGAGRRARASATRTRSSCASSSKHVRGSSLCDLLCDRCVSSHTRDSFLPPSHSTPQRQSGRRTTAGTTSATSSATRMCASPRPTTTAGRATGRSWRTASSRPWPGRRRRSEWVNGFGLIWIE